MNRKIINALLWKEWRETRWKWLAGLLLLLAPLYPLVYMLKWAGKSRVLMGVNPQYPNFPGYVQVVLNLQFMFLLTFGLFVIVLFSAAAVTPELDSRRIFLLFERPVRRSQVLLNKFLFVGLEVLASIGLSILITTSVIYATILIRSNSINLTIFCSDYLRLIGGMSQMTLIIGCVGLAAFSLVFFLCVLFEKWWVGAVVGWIALTLFFNSSVSRFLEWVLRYEDSHTRHVKLAALELAFPLVRPLPLVILLTLSVAFYFATLYFFTRKEMK